MRHSPSERHSMEQTPAVSVVIIFYNADRFLEQAIASVFSQTDQDWELLLADDGSTDRSSDIALAYVHRSPKKVRYLEHPGHQNRGMSATRNLGIRQSRAPWIAFLDADDVWETNKLSEQRRLLALHPTVGLLYGSPLYWFSWSPELFRFPDCQPGISTPPETLVSPPELMLKNYPLGPGPAPCPSDFVVSRFWAERVGGFEEHFRGHHQMYEDQAFLAKIYLHAPVYVSGQCWLRYRQHPSACTSTVRDTGHYREVRQFFLRYLEQYLRAQEIKDPTVWHALRRAFWPYEHPHLWRVQDFLFRIRRRLRREFFRLGLGTPSSPLERR
jgi:glycosyltransferase involved in cell wall biosynthesis